MFSDIRNLSKVNSILILFILVSICYVNSLGNNFVWDDEAHILRNDYLKDFKFLPQIFAGTMLYNIGIRSIYYRPLQAVSYMVDYHVWKFNPFGYHLINLFLHSFNAILIFILLYELSYNRLISFLSSVIFAIHPIHTSAVSFITARSILLVTLFILSSLIFFKKFCEFKKIYLLICSLIFSILALLSKEEALVLPFLIILLDYFFVKYTKRDNYHFLQRMGYYLPFFILVAVYLAIVMLFISDRNILFNNRQQVIIGASYFLGTFSECIKLLIIPVNLRFERLWGDINKVQLSGFLGFILLVILSLKYSKLAILGCIWFLICYIPISNIFVNLNVPLRENWLYLPSIGFFIMLVVFIMWIHRTFCNKLMRRFLFLSVSFVIPIYCILTVRENFSWSNDRVFFEKIVRLSPNSSDAHYNLGITYERLMLFDRAIKEMRQAITFDPKNLDAYLVLGDIYSTNKKDFVMAEKFYNKIIEVNPKFLCVYMKLIALYKKTGQKDKEQSVLSKLDHL